MAEGWRLRLLGREVVGGGREGSRGARGGVRSIGLAEVDAIAEALSGAETFRAVTGDAPLEGTRCIIPISFLAVLVAEAAAAELRRVVWARRVRGLPIAVGFVVRGVEPTSEIGEVVAETDRGARAGAVEGSRRGRVLVEVAGRVGARVDAGRERATA